MNKQIDIGYRPHLTGEAALLTLDIATHLANSADVKLMVVFLFFPRN